MAPNQRVILLFLLLGLILAVMVNPRGGRTDPQAVRYDELVQLVRRGQITEAEVMPDEVLATTTEKKQVRTSVPDVDATAAMMQENGVMVRYRGQPGRAWWSDLLSALLPGLLMVGLFFLMMRSSAGGGQAFQFGRSRARLHKQGERQVTMVDVAGVQEAKDDLMEVVDFLRHPNRYAELGARIPKGVLLSGPPGTGKTLLARAVSGEAGVPFYSLSGSEFVELFAGVGAARVRDLFAKAKASAPCIIFVDEIDAVGRHRGSGIGGGNDEREQTLNQLLVELDGFQPDSGVIVIAATNRADVLDPALLRPGRFDRVVYVDPPDRVGRAEILAVHARGLKMAADAGLEELARITVGFTGADLANLLNEGALRAARRRSASIGKVDLEAAFERILTGGPEKKRLVSPKERERVAFHEAGHALVSRFLEHSDPIHKVTIVPRGRAGGYVLFRPEDDRRMHSRLEVIDRLAGMLAGRAAEEVVLGDLSTGAASDLEQATELARLAVTQWGMSEEVGPMSVQQGGSSMPLFMHPLDTRTSERTASVIDRALRKLVGSAYQRARDLLLHHREGLDRVAHILLERETISGTELLELLPQS